MGRYTNTTVRRVVTTHAQGKSAVLIDEDLPLIAGFASNAVTVWQNHKYPAELSETDALTGSAEIYAAGSLIRVVDFPPRSQGHNHRTASLDYGIVLDGELELVLETGSSTIVRAGDIVVQQATIHQWNNKTDRPTRVVFALVASETPTVDGVELEDCGYPEKFKPRWK